MTSAIPGGSFAMGTHCGPAEECMPAGRSLSDEKMVCSGLPTDRSAVAPPLESSHSDESILMSALGINFRQEARLHCCFWWASCAADNGNPAVRGNFSNRVVFLRATSGVIHGHFPVELTGLGCLEVLNLSCNGLTGSIPVKLARLELLQELDVSANHLTGSIPIELAELRNLKELNLSSNELTGSIPAELGKLGLLEVLNLCRNRLTGSIPVELGELRILQELNLCQNTLTGSIPDELGGLGNLKVLNLAENDLTGAIPFSMWKLQGLRVFVVAGNLLKYLTGVYNGPKAGDAMFAAMSRLDVSGLHWQDMIGDNPWVCPPATVVAGGRPSLIRFYDCWKEQGTMDEIRSLKVVLAGAAGAGKTSLVRSLKARRGDRTIGHNPSTAGVEIHDFESASGIQIQFYDFAGQVKHYGLHQLMLSEGALYVLAWNAKKFEGKQNRNRDEVIWSDIMQWIRLLHLRVPRCTVMLVATHCDELQTPEKESELLGYVERRVREFHDAWMDQRPEKSQLDRRLTILPGVVGVGCRLSGESPTGKRLDEVMSRLKANVETRYIPPPWGRALNVLRGVAQGTMPSTPASTEGTQAVAGVPRPWVYHVELYRALERHVSSLKTHDPMKRFLRGVRNRREAVDNAIELMESRGTIVLHEPFVFLDISWLARGLKPIVCLEGDGLEENDQSGSEERTLDTAPQQTQAKDDLVKDGVLRKELALDLWGTKNEPEDLQETLQELLATLGVVVPQSHLGIGPGPTPSENGDRDRGDYFVVERLREEPTPQQLSRISKLRADRHGLKASWMLCGKEAPYGFLERVVARCDKMGTLSTACRWKYGAVFEDERKETRLILSYANTNGKYTLTAETPQKTDKDFATLGFAASCVLRLVGEFPGASWRGEVECVKHRDMMYLLASDKDPKHHVRGAHLVPPSRDWYGGKRHLRQQGSSCSQASAECYIPPRAFGSVIDIRSPAGRCSGVFIDVAREESSPDGDDEDTYGKHARLCAHVNDGKLWTRSMGALGTGAVVLLVVGFEMGNTAQWVTGLVLLMAAVVLGNIRLGDGSLHVSSHQAQSFRRTRPEDVV